MADKKITPPNARKISIPTTPVSLERQAGIQKFVILVSVVSVIVVLVGGYFIWDLITKNIQKAREIKSQDAYIELSKDRFEKLEKAKKALVSAKQGSDGQKSPYELVTVRALPNEADFATIITIVSTLQRESVVKIPSIKKTDAVSTTVASGGTTASQASQSYNIDISATGSPENCLDLIRKIEQSLRVFNVRSIGFPGGITNKSVTSGQSTIDITLKLDTYYTKPVDVATSQVNLSEYDKNVSGNKDYYK